MNHNEIVFRLTDIFQDIFEDPSIELSDTMMAADVSGWDSLSHINLVLAVEKGFGIKLTTREVKGLENVGDFIHLIEKKIG